MKIKIKNKFIEVEEMNGFDRFKGLMFRKKSKPLLFRFEKPVREPIHSFFCKSFYAVWMKDGKIVDEKLVKPFRFFVRPKDSFTDLVEFPVGKEKFKKNI